MLSYQEKMLPSCIVGPKNQNYLLHCTEETIITPVHCIIGGRIFFFYTHGNHCNEGGDKHLGPPWGYLALGHMGAIPIVPNVLKSLQCRIVR